MPEFINLVQIADGDEIYKPQLVITHIFPNSHIKNFKIIFEYDIIKTINNLKTNTLDEFRKNILKTKNIRGNKFIEIETEIDSKIVISLKNILNEEKNFSNIFKYKLSSIYHHFNKSKKLKTKQSKKKIINHKKNNNNSKSKKNIRKK